MILKLFFLFWIWTPFLQADVLDPSQAGLEQNGLVTVNSLLMEGNKFLKQQKWGEAGTSFRSVLKREPHSVPGAIGLAASLAHHRKRDEALGILTQAITWANRAQKAVLIRRIHVLSRLFVSNETFKTYQDALNLMLEKKYRAAKEKFERALTEEPDNVEVLLRLGQCLLLDGDFDRAVSKFQAAQKLDPYEPVINLWLGRSFFLKGSHSEAISELKIANQGLQGSEQSAVWLGEALYGSGQSFQAIRLLDKDAKAWPFHVASLISLAKLRIQGAHPDSQTLWTARKDLQLAMSRLEQYYDTDSSLVERELSLDLRKSMSETKSEIQKLLQQVQSRLDEISSHR